MQRHFTGTKWPEAAAALSLEKAPSAHGMDPLHDAVRCAQYRLVDHYFTGSGASLSPDEVCVSTLANHLSDAETPPPVRIDAAIGLGPAVVHAVLSDNMKMATVAGLKLDESSVPEDYLLAVRASIITSLGTLLEAGPPAEGLLTRRRIARLGGLVLGGRDGFALLPGQRSDDGFASAFRRSYPSMVRWQLARQLPVSTQ